MLSRCFGLIESSTLEQTREETETEKMTHLESLVELGLSSTFSTILTQCSKEIFKVCVTKGERTETIFVLLVLLNFCKTLAGIIYRQTHIHRPFLVV